MDHGNADALSRLLAGDDPLFDKEEEEGKGPMVLTISMVDQQLDPDSDPLKPGVLARESKRDPVISTVMRYVGEGWSHTIKGLFTLQTGSNQFETASALCAFNAY